MPADRRNVVPPESGRLHNARAARVLPAIAALVVTLAAVSWPHPAAGEAPASQPASATAVPAVGPIAYYVAKCARCHGDVSVAYTGLEKPKRGKELEQVIDDMAVGPAQSPLDAEGLKQQTALHEAMFGKTPFVWLDPGAGARVKGEVIPGTTLTFEPTTGPATTPAVDENRFDLPRQPGTLVGRRGEQVVKIAVTR